MKRHFILFILALNLCGCTLFPQNNDRIIPENTPQNKIVTLIQKDNVIRVNAFNKYIVRTSLIIDGEEVKRHYFNKQESIRRHPVPNSILVKCSAGIGNIHEWKIHAVQGKLDEGKNYIFQCNNLNSFSIKEFWGVDILG